MTDDLSAFVAIRNGEVRGIMGIRDDSVSRDFLMEWALDPSVTCIIRVPIDVARKCFDATEQEVRDMVSQAAGSS